MFDESVFPFGSMTPTSPPSYEFLDTIDENNPISQMFRQTPIILVATPYAEGVPCTLELDTSDTTNISSSPLALSSHPSADSDLSTTDPLVMGFPSLSHPFSGHHMVTRFRHGIVKPIHKLNLHVDTPSLVPHNYLQAF